MAPRPVGIVHSHAGRPVPFAGRYELDPSTTSVEFVARTLRVTRMRGRFTGVTGTITVEEVPELSHTDVTIDAASVSTGRSEWDAHLRSPGWLDVECFPTIVFRSTTVRAGTAGAWTVGGELTVKDVTRPLAFDVTFDGPTRWCDGRWRIAFGSRTTVDCADLGLTYDTPLGSGQPVIGRRLQMLLAIQAIAS